MINDDTEQIAALRSALIGFFHDLGKFVNSYPIGPAPNSLGAKEQAEFHGSSALVTSMASVWQFIEVGGEHVLQLVKSLTKPMLPIASLTCVRSMLESCALGTWLFDPSIEAMTRMMRMVALRYQGNVEQLKYIQANGASPVEIAKLRDRIDVTVQDAVSLGFERILDKKSRVISVGQRMPSATEMIRDMLDEEVLYRILSAVAHSHSWAVIFLAYKTSRSTNGSRVGGVPIHRGEKVMSPEVVQLLASSAARALARPAWAQCRYLGWDDTRLADIFERTFDQLSERPEDRFWRGQTGGQ